MCTTDYKLWQLEHENKISRSQNNRKSFRLVKNWKLKMNRTYELSFIIYY